MTRSSDERVTSQTRPNQRGREQAEQARRCLAGAPMLSRRADAPPPGRRFGLSAARTGRLIFGRKAGPSESGSSESAGGASQSPEGIGRRLFLFALHRRSLVSTQRPPLHWRAGRGPLWRPRRDRGPGLGFGGGGVGHVPPRSRRRSASACFHVRVERALARVTSGGSRAETAQADSDGTLAFPARLPSR